MEAPAGVTQEEGHTGFLHLPSAVRALIFLAIRIQPSLSLVDREVVRSQNFFLPEVFKEKTAVRSFITTAVVQHQYSYKYLVLY